MLGCGWERRRIRTAGRWLISIYKHLEDDATVADLADSDFGDGGTNRKGHILSGAWQVTAWGQAKATIYLTKVEDETRQGRTTSAGFNSTGS